MPVSSWWEVAIKLVLAALLGGVIGFERERRGKPAGLRTHMLVSLAAAVFVMAAREAAASTGEPLDSVRAMAGVAQGVGFLGAGVILQSRGEVRVLLMVRDSVTGLLYPPVVATGEEAAAAWEALLTQAQRAGLRLAEVRALVSDGAQGLSGEAAQAARQRVRQELTALVHGVLDAPGFDAAEGALTHLQAHPQGAGLWGVLNARFVDLLTHRMAGHEGVGRTSPEWMWRDFRLRLGRGRNHGSEERLQRAGTVFTIYRNLTPAQRRRERKRRYRHPGKCALEVAGVAPEGCSYLDALQV